MKKYPINEIKKSDEDFPEILRGIKNCPEKLYFRGNWDKVLFEKSLAIVGSRKMTRYGQGAVAKFMPTLVAKGVSVISGFMYGVDSEAHKQCLELGGKTIAVLGWGLDYEAGDEKLYGEILKGGGLIISEYEPDFKATTWSFPQRNRVVSGLASLGVLIVEAGEKSGSLITARLAREQDRKVWAVPGPIDGAVSVGCNWLIKEGLAKMAISPADILEIKIKAEQTSLFEEGLDKEERQVVECLTRESMSIDELAREMEVDINKMMTIIAKLSLDDRIEENAGRLFIKKW